MLRFSQWYAVHVLSDKVCKIEFFKYAVSMYGNVL